MSPRKKQHATDADRRRAYIARKEAEGRKQVTVWLSAKVIKKMDQDRKEEDRSSYIESLIKGAGK